MESEYVTKGLITIRNLESQKAIDETAVAMNLNGTEIKIGGVNYIVHEFFKEDGQPAEALLEELILSKTKENMK